MNNEFEQIEIFEGDGKSEVRLNNKKIRGLMGYSIKRGTDIVDITLNISVPVTNFKTL